MKSKRLLLLTAVVAALCLVTTNGIALAAAPPVSSNVGVSATVRASVSLEIMDGPVAFGTVDPDTAVPDQSLTVRVKSNKNWNLSVKTDGLMTSGGSTLAANQLLFDGGDLTNTQFSTSDQALFTTSGDQGKTAQQDVVVTYKLTVDWTDDPGLYTATHTYTVAQP
jgi:hypothetical protein